MQRFSKYLLGGKFEIRMDHKPLLGLLSEMKSVPRMASGSIIRWSLLLAGYDYKVVYKPGPSISNADCLSHFPLVEDFGDLPLVREEICLVEHLAYTSVNAKDIRRWTDCNPLLADVRACIQGWGGECELP